MENEQQKVYPELIKKHYMGAFRIFIIIRTITYLWKIKKLI